MAPGPMETDARVAIDMRAQMFEAGDLENVEAVEIDAVSAFRRLLRDGSPRLRQALINAELEMAPQN